MWQAPADAHDVCQFVGVMVWPAAADAQYACRLAGSWCARLQLVLMTLSDL